MSTDNKRYIKIPKGTMVYDNGPDTGYECHFGATGKPSTRDMVVEFFRFNAFYASFSSSDPKWTDGSCVMWSSGKKFALASDVELDVPAPPPKKAPVSKGLTIRQRMTKGSKWKLTQPAAVIKPGPAVPDAHGWDRCQPVTAYELPVGTEFEVAGKSTTSISFNTPTWCYFSGIWIPIKVNGSKNITYVALSELNKKPEQLGEAPKIFIFAIYDTVKKQYYSGYEYSWGSHSSPLEYTDKISKAKKFKRLADVRAHCLIQSGYYDNLPETWGIIPEWMTSQKMFDVPKTWVIHKIDKATKVVEDTIELIDTFNRSWKLRSLTVKYNSAVRSVYSDLEKKGKLSDYSAMMMFAAKRDDRWDYELTAQEEADINALIKRYSSSEVKTQKTQTGFAIAVKDASTATMIYLTYGGTLNGVVIDFNTMEEVVNEK